MKMISEITMLGRFCQLILHIAHTYTTDGLIQKMNVYTNFAVCDFQHQGGGFELDNGSAYE